MPPIRSFEELKLMVNGTETPLSAVAQIFLKGPSLLINIFDKKLVPSVQKALCADSNLFVSSTENLISVTFPKPSKEQRQEIIVSAKQSLETTKVAVRNTRRKLLGKFNAEWNKLDTVTRKRLEKEVDEVCAKKTGEAEAIFSLKKAALEK
ncbi:ribosome-recycling factor-like [Zophobas morio]|uniref:ribosome-recycling factor-like n=1 Tax=Zophobas morio TaxID=2755281 RepID=UPI003083039E